MVYSRNYADPRRRRCSPSIPQTPYDRRRSKLEKSKLNFVSARFYSEKRSKSAFYIHEIDDDAVEKELKDWANEKGFELKPIYSHLSPTFAVLILNLVRFFFIFFTYILDFYLDFLFFLNLD